MWDGFSPGVAAFGCPPIPLWECVLSWMSGLGEGLELFIHAKQNYFPTSASSQRRWSSCFHRVSFAASAWLRLDLFCDSAYSVIASARSLPVFASVTLLKVTFVPTAGN